MKFEFDPGKSRSNKHKHGIDFIKAQAIWADPWYIMIKTRSDIETRFMAIGRIDEKHWSAIFTLQDDAVRIISVRRSRKEEIELYEQNT